ncbi:MAG: hypothetical protein IKP95_01465 [Ruminococcus sp.]|nr:hypothetical protein [Ruminococcus sp.]
MDYSIYKEELITVSEGTPNVKAELIAASSEDVPYYTAVEGRVLTVGSVAIVPSEGKIYLLDTDLLWTDWSSGDKLPAPEDDDDEDGGDDQDA